MAWKHLAHTSISTIGQGFAMVRDFLCARNATYNFAATGIGWTLIDSSYAVDENNPAVGDWFVIKSTGESGNEQLIFKFTLRTSAYINIHGFIYWDTISHTGVNGYGDSATNCLTIGTGTFYVSISGNLNYVYLSANATISWNSPYGHSSFGKIIYFGDFGPVSITNGPLTAGSEVTIQVADATVPWLQIGRKVYVYDFTTGALELTRVKSNNGVNQITAPLVNSYGATTKLRSMLPYLCPKALGWFPYSTNQLTMPIYLDGTVSYFPTWLVPAAPTSTYQPGPNLTLLGQPFFGYSNISLGGNIYNPIAFVFAFEGVVFVNTLTTIIPFNDTVDGSDGNTYVHAYTGYFRFFLRINSD
jgi:hypothetical protein